MNISKPKKHGNTPPSRRPLPIKIYVLHKIYVIISYTAMHHIITFKSTVECIYDSGPIRL